MSASWADPTAAIPLRWGIRRDRAVLGTILAAAGPIGSAGGTTATPWLFAAAAAAIVAGWAVQPAAGWRRVIAAPLGILVGGMLLAGPRFLWIVVLAYLGWLLVRHLPPLSYLSAVVLFGGSFAISATARGYEAMLPALAAVIALTGLCGWLAFALAKVRRNRSRPGANTQPPNPPRP